MRWLVENGAELTLRASDGTSVFEWAVYGGSLEIITYLEAQPAVQIHSKNAFGCGAVHWAAARGDVAVLRWLYEKVGDGSDTSGIDDNHYRATGPPPNHDHLTTTT